jgi:hypothetical protein
MADDFFISVIYVDKQIATNVPGATWVGSGTLGLGHTGFAVVDGDTGQIRYFDYGRYNQTDGIVIEPLVGGISDLTSVDLDQLRAGNYSALGNKLSIVHAYGGTIQFNAFTVGSDGFSRIGSAIGPLVGIENGPYGEWTFFNTCHNFVQDAATLLGIPLDELDGFRATPSGSANSLLSTSGGILYNPNIGVSIVVDFNDLGLLTVSIEEQINSGDLSAESALILLESLIMSGDTYMAQYVALGIGRSEGGCFMAGTPILMSDNSMKPIEQVDAGDIILSYNARSTLVPGRVTGTFRKEVSHLLDVHGLKVTPAHATLCGEGMFKGRHVPIIDILLSDGALVQVDGTLIRMAINAPVGSVADAFVKVTVAAAPEDMQSNSLAEAEMRVGTLLFDREGTPISVLDCLTAEGYAFDPDSGLVAKPGETPHPLFWFGRLPRPEDYILTRSQETLEGILMDGEWEGSRTELIAGRLRQSRTMRVN